MDGFTQQELHTRLYHWFMRRTTPSAVRKIGELPISVGSDIGNLRNENQDRVAVLKVQLDRNQSFTVVALCDGMGGMAEGTACASMAIACFFATCIRCQNVPPQTRLVMATQEANVVVHNLYQGRGGATLSALLLDGYGNTFGVNVGDSRIYSYRENKLEQLTVDDTMAGLLNRAENDLHSRNELIQFIGMGNGVEPHIVQMPSSNDLMLLSSDGAHYIDKGVMQMLIQNAKEPAVAVRRLIEVAKWCGGRDNASVAIVSPLVLQPQLFDDTGIIQVWDPFGELQVILPKAYTVKEIVSRPVKTLPPPIILGSERSKKRPAKQQKKAKPSKRKEVVDEPETSDDKGKEPPQLNIYFKGNG